MVGGVCRWVERSHRRCRVFRIENIELDIDIDIYHAIVVYSWL